MGSIWAKLSRNSDIMLAGAVCAIVGMRSSRCPSGCWTCSSPHLGWAGHAHGALMRRTPFSLGLPQPAAADHAHSASASTSRPHASSCCKPTQVRSSLRSALRRRRQLRRRRRRVSHPVVVNFVASPTVRAAWLKSPPASPWTPCQASRWHRRRAQRRRHQRRTARRADDGPQEADFYGAMDGASNFVKGDAIAAIVIMIITSAPPSSSASCR